MWKRYFLAALFLVAMSLMVSSVREFNSVAGVNNISDVFTTCLVMVVILKPLSKWAGVRVPGPLVFSVLFFILCIFITEYIGVVSLHGFVKAQLGAGYVVMNLASILLKE
jgi:hypothetical protein